MGHMVLQYDKSSPALVITHAKLDFAAMVHAYLAVVAAYIMDLPHTPHLEPFFVQPGRQVESLEAILVYIKSLEDKPNLHKTLTPDFAPPFRPTRAHVIPCLPMPPGCLAVLAVPRPPDGFLYIRVGPGGK